MPPAGFEPTISAGEHPQTYALDRTATGTGHAGLWDDYCIMDWTEMEGNGRRLVIIREFPCRN